MEFTGKVVGISPLESGVSKKDAEKTWKKQCFVLEDDKPNYPNRLVLELFNDKVDMLPKMGEMVTTEYHTNANEYNGKFFGSNSVYKLKILSQDEAQQSNAALQTDAAPVQQAQSDDLPF